MMKPRVDEREGGAGEALPSGTTPPAIGAHMSGEPTASSTSTRRRRSGAGIEPDIMFAAALAILGLAAMTQGGWIFAKAQLAQLLLERAFDESLATGLPVKPWSWADTWPVARLDVPRLGARAVVLAGSSGQAMAFGPGHVDGTPVPGDPGTAVYSAHRDTHFRFLQHVRIGDRIDVLLRDGRGLRFAVTATEVVRWDASGIDAAASGYRLVLATCWPFDARTAGPDRYLVHAELVGEAKPPSVPRRNAG